MPETTWVPQIVASVPVEGRRSTEFAARAAAMAGADWIELRLDRMRPGRLDWPALVGEIALPVLATCRTPRDGGAFEGTEAERMAVLGEAIRAGARGVDLEHWVTRVPAGLEAVSLVVRSYHDLEGPGETAALESLRDRLLAEYPGAVVKIATTAADLAEAAPVLDLLGRTEQRVAPTVAFAMGEAAWPSRILAALLGAPLVYASPAPGISTAAGQPPVSELSGLYRIGDCSTNTAILGVLGMPARHSLGPWLHNRMLRRAGLDAVYLPLETARPRAVLDMLPRRRLRGVSVTSPYKRTLRAICHRLDADARAADAVNTLTFEAHGQVVGHNTDVAGVRTALVRAGMPREGRGACAAVLGTGGAGRAAAAALTGCGYSVVLLGRKPEADEALQRFAAQRGLRSMRLEAAALAALRPRVVVNATPVGGAGGPPGPLLPDWRPEPGTFVLDMVYRPARTEFLERARAAGAVAVSGLDMFLTQAAEQLRLFVGSRPTEKELELLLAGARGR